MRVKLPKSLRDVSLGTDHTAAVAWTFESVPSRKPNQAALAVCHPPKPGRVLVVKTGEHKRIVLVDELGILAGKTLVDELLQYYLDVNFSPVCLSSTATELEPAG